MIIEEFKTLKKEFFLEINLKKTEILNLNLDDSS
jgi:hypothetical protein